MKEDNSQVENHEFSEYNKQRYFYYANGLYFNSSLKFPELTPAEADSWQATVSIDFGFVPENLESPVSKGARFQASPGRFLLQMDDIARFIAVDGKQIIIEPIGEIKESEIRVFLLASVFGALAHQRHFLPIHASAILHKGEAVLFAGDSGAGKSTLAASFLNRGYEVISDDISNISRCEETGRMSVYPGYAQLKLWANSLKFLDEKPEDHQCLRPHIEKFGKRIPYFNSHKPIPVKAIYMINIRAGQEVLIEEINGRKRFNEIAYHTFRQKLIEGLGVRQTHFTNVQQLSKEVTVKNVKRNEKLKKLPELLKLLEEDILNLYS